MFRLTLSVACGQPQRARERDTERERERQQFTAVKLAKPKGSSSSSVSSCVNSFTLDWQHKKTQGKPKNPTTTKRKPQKKKVK